MGDGDHRPRQAGVEVDPRALITVIGAIALS
jgi:hypothetical protein